MTGRSRRLVSPTFHRKVGGQTSVFVVVTAAIMLVSALTVYNAGRLALQRIQLQTAADAAAYSGAVMLARSYNFSAYANRGMVANHVAIAQAVGLASWAKYYCLIYTLTNCGEFPTLGTGPGIEAALLQVPPGAPGIVPFELYRVLSLAMYQSIDVALPPLVTTADAIVTVLSAASNAYHLAALAELGGAAVDSGLLAEVVRANDADASISVFGVGTVAASTALITTFTTYRDPLTPGSDVGDRLRGTVDNALDGFSKVRASLEVLPFPLFSFGACVTAAGVPGVGAAIVSAVYGGLTTLTPDNRQWNATDSAVFPALYACGGVIPPTQNSPPVPAGTITPLLVPPSFASASVGGVAPGPFDIGASYAGLQGYWDVSNTTGGLLSDSTPPLTLYVRRGSDTIKTLSQMNDAGTFPVAGGELRLEEALAGNEMQVGASSQAYFVRPDTPGYLTTAEYGNLFNPYWEARLVNTGLLQDAAAAAAQDLLP